jgi:hypothetical protein
MKRYETKVPQDQQQDENASAIVRRLGTGLSFRRAIAPAYHQSVSSWRRESSIALFREWYGAC